MVFKDIIIYLFFLSTLSYGQVKEASKPTVSLEIPIETLHKKGIVPIITNYKVSYFKVMPYLFYNEQDTFNELQGDFYNVDHSAMKDINIMVGYWKKYGDEQHSLIVLLSLSKSSVPALKDTPIKVESSKHGIFENRLLEQSGFNKSQQRQLFVKKLNLENDQDAINKVFDDVSTITVGNQKYTFLNPELKLN